MLSSVTGDVQPTMRAKPSYMAKVGIWITIFSVSVFAVLWVAVWLSTLQSLPSTTIAVYLKADSGYGATCSIHVGPRGPNKNFIVFFSCRRVEKLGKVLSSSGLCKKLGWEGCWDASHKPASDWLLPLSYETKGGNRAARVSPQGPCWAVGLQPPRIQDERRSATVIPNHGWLVGRHDLEKRFENLLKG